MMHCKRCDGTIWVETERDTGRYYDLVCIACGRRKHVDTWKNPFGKWLRRNKLYSQTSALFWVERPHIGRRTLLERNGEEWRIVFEHNISDGRETVQAGGQE